MYGLPHSGKIVQDVLIGRLATHGYLQTGTTCLFRHVTNGVAFSLVVDDFAVKFKDLASADHLIDCLELYDKLTVKKNATKYLGLLSKSTKLSAKFVSLPRVLSLRHCNNLRLIQLPLLVHQPFINLLDSGKKHRLPLLQIHRLFLLLRNIIAYSKLVECYYIIV
jgi:hypothetical protein